jgi:glycosyltransferase involved in cell wall biosynthesis
VSKLLVILPSLEVGGAERLAITQINWLHAHGYNVFLAVISDKVVPSLQQQVDLPPGNLLLLNTSYTTVSLGALESTFLNRKTLISFCRKNGITHVLAHLPLAHIWGRLLKSKMPLLRLFCYHHSLQYAANPLDSILKKVFHWLNRRWSRSFDDMHIFISAAVRQNIFDYLPLKRGEVIFNAVPESKIELQGKDPVISRKEVSSVQLLIPGRLHPVKGHLFFLYILSALVKSTRHKVHLTIAGGGDLKQAIEEKVIELQLQPYCTLTGPLNNQQLLQAIAESDLIIIPSIVEGLGIVAIEALMLGKTVLASDAGGLSEVIKHGQNGYLFKVGNQADCLDKLNTILDRLPESLLPAAVLRQDYMSRFGFEAHMSKLLSILQGN